MTNIKNYRNLQFNSLRTGKISHNDEVGTYEAVNVFSYQSTWGTSTLRDAITTTGSGSTSNPNGAIRLSTGTTIGSTVILETIREGVYQPGKTAETGTGMKIVGRPTGSGVVRIGAFNPNNGFFFEITSDEVRCIIRRNGVDQTFSQNSWNFDRYDGSGSFANNPSGKTYDANKPYIYAIRFSYYGVGPAVFELQEAGDDDDPTEMVTSTIARLTSTEFPSIVDPNTSIRVEVDNGDTAEDVIVDVGGRRYDVLGIYDPEKRRTGDYRLQTTVGTTGWTPLVALRKKSEFPVGRGSNTVNCFVSNYGVNVITNSVVIFLFETTDLNGDWTVPQNFTDTEIALEANINSTTFTPGNPLAGPFIIPAGGRGNETPEQFANLKQQIPFYNSRTIVLAAQAVGGDATVDSWLTGVENW